MIEQEEIIELKDADVEVLFPETLYEPQTDLLEELCIIWKPKWYQTVYYKLRAFLQTGKWPIRVWYIPWNMEICNADGEVVFRYPKLEQKRFNKMYQEILKQTEAEQELWNALLSKKNPYFNAKYLTKEWWESRKA